ncbi:MAG: filamentous hemagglutinin N-terminal domain-containing protein, partial [Sulfuricurvum sp.]|nr:filamentous hemagglutinin N-terminal domain-containing protein [Sulfuricurvum sp.]
MMFTHLYRQSISCILSAALLGNTLYAGGIVVDSSASAANRPMMESTANAIPLINIVTPNSTGLSHNKFSEFNIEQRGVIFNNATGAALTQLGGWVQGNANLGTTPARVILNEVTGTNRSLLSGYGEVAGNRADLIIANPNGITVNGGGFINTSRATLTTGMAQINGDTLAGFHVQRGDILIEGSGLNASNIDRVELYTKALLLNAQIHAKALDVVTGENTITRDGTIASDNVIGSEAFSIDSSALGGIYADTIRLVGTDKGVGINLPVITYASDSLSLSADGHIILATSIAENALSVQSHSDSITLKEQTGADHVTLIASHNLANEGDLVGMQVDVSVGDMANSGTMYSDTMNLNISNSLSNTGILSAYSSLSTTAMDMMNGNGALIESQNAVFDISHSLHNTGTLRASLLSLTTPTLLNEQDIIADIAQIETTSLTNNALIKGADTLSVDTQTLINNGGMIGGNQLSIHAETITNNEVLYSANVIDLSASNTLRNTAGATIKSAGSINIHDTGTLRNETAIIEADGDISIRATAVENLSSMTPTLSTQHISRYVTRMITRSGGGDNWNWDDLYTEKWLDSIVKTGYIPSYILSGGDMLINAATHNRYSMIAADGDLYLSGSLNNEAALNAHEIIETQMKYVRENQDCGWSGCHWNNNSYWGALNHADTITDHVYSTIQAGGSIYGNLISINNADVVEGSVPTNTSSQGIPPSSSFTNISVGSQYTLPSGNYSQFVTVTNPALPYLIESNPLYADYNTFISSDYIMSRLHLDTAADTKRLGDARYETTLVRDAVFRLTGERYLAGFGSDTTQYQSLMDNALAVSGDLHLELGVSLSASQVAKLTRDIVWMEDRVVSGQHVLVPIVYLASLKTANLSGGGKIIAGADMQLAVTQGLNNAGEIRAGGNLLAMADTITNTGGSIKSTGDMLLHTTNDITNTSGKISGNNVALISDNGSIISKIASNTINLNRNGTTGTLGTVGESASIRSSGDMVLSASKDITLTGAETSAGGNVALSGENVTLSALEQNAHYINRASNGTNEIESVKQHASTLTAGGEKVNGEAREAALGHVRINAAKDVTLNSSSVAGANVVLNAGENVNITAANDREFMDVQTHNKSTFSSSSKRDMTLKESVVSSSIEGNNISITSGKDTTLQAANLKAQENIQVDAGGDINVLAKAYRQGELHQESKSSLGGLSKSVSIDQLDALNLQAATLKTEAKNIIMNSGKDINIIASKVDAAADVQLKAFEDLLIAAGEEQSSQQHIREKTSFNIAGLAGIATGMFGIDTGPLYTKEIHNKGNYDTTSASSSIKAGGSITADTGSTTIIGSNLDAQKDVAIKADIGGINVLTSQELSNASSLDKKTEIKLANLKEMMQGVVDQTKASLSTDGSGSKVKIKVASATFDESEVKSSAVHNVSSSITSHEGSVKLDS